MTADVKESGFFEYVDDALSCSLSQSIIAKDMNAIKRILRKRQNNPVPLQADNRGWTALHVAASEDEHADILELLLRNKDVLLLDLNAKTFQEETALYLASERGCEKNCAILLESQCNPKLSKPDASTPLHVASQNGHVAIVSQLIAHDTNLNCQDFQGFTPLHLASMSGHLEVTRVLMMNKQTNVSISDGYGNIPLHLACRSGHPETIKILLDADSSQINWRNYEGFTPLMLAIQSHSTECVKYLIDHGANADQCTEDNVISLQYAALSGVKEILELVLQSTSQKCIQEQCMLRIQSLLPANSGVFHSLMSCVIKSGSPECMSVLLESGLPKSVLEAPYLESEEDFFWVYSPLAYLFSTSTCEGSNSRTLDQFLRLLLKHGITYMNEFNQTIELKSRTLVLRYVNPFSDIFEAHWPRVKRNHYLNTLIENGITTDYCLQCYIERKCIFRDFDIIDLQRFYEPVVKAMNEDNVEVIEFFIVNSAILEPYHLWEYLHYGTLFTYGMCRRNVLDYVMKLRAFGRTPVYADVRRIIAISNRTSVYSRSQHETVRHFNLQQLCREVIRHHLRDETIEDNLKNFKRKINALPLPNLLKNYLHFKVR